MAATIQHDSGSVDSGYAAEPEQKDVISPEIHSLTLGTTVTTTSSTDVDPRVARRRSSIFDTLKLPQEFSTFIRSQSLSSKQSSSLTTDSVPSLTSDTLENEQCPPDMFNTDEGTPRKGRRSDNMFINFFTSHSRSRSRSRSKPSSSTSVTSNHDHQNDTPRDYPPASTSRKASAPGHHTDSRGREASMSKRSPIVPSRPISSNTSTTNTTITPATPKATRQMGSSAAQGDPTPKQEKKRSLFGMLLPGSRRSSFNSSRNPSPASTSHSRGGSIDLSCAPPMPTKYTPSSSRGPSTDSNSSAARGRDKSRSSKRHSAKPEADLITSPFLKLTSFKNSSKTSVNNVQVIRVSHPRPKTSLQHLHAVAAGEPSSQGRLAPSSRASADSHNYTSSSTHPSFMPGHKRGSLSSPVNPTHSSDPPLSRSLDGSRVSSSTNPYAPTSEFGSLSRSSNGSRSGAVATDPGYRYYQKMAAVDEERASLENGRLDSGPSASRKPQDYLTVPSSNPARSTVAPTSRKTKHSSLDLHPRATHRSQEASGILSDGGHNSNGMHVQYAMDRRWQGGASPHSHEASGSTASHSYSNHSEAKSSSLGRSAGKRLTTGGPNTRFAAAHGPFPFEPPVPSPTSQTGRGSPPPRPPKDTTNSIDALRERHRRERERDAQREHERQREFQREQDRERRRVENEQRRTAKPTYERQYDSVPSSPALGFRSGAKGRQLDLDLGLSWAPTKIRQDALLPALSMRRTTSQGSAASGRGGHDVERLNIGKGIAESFKKALDDRAYASFKNYVHRYDANDIPLDGPNGIVARAERLLNASPNISSDRKKYILDDFVRVIMQNPPA